MSVSEYISSVSKLYDTSPWYFKAFLLLVTPIILLAKIIITPLQ